MSAYELVRVQPLEGNTPITVEVHGTTAAGVLVRYPNTEGLLTIPPSWIIDYRPSQHPEWNGSTKPAGAQLRMTEHQRLTLGALAAAGDIGLLDDEHEVITGLINTSAGKRRIELERLGFCEKAGKTRHTRNHSSAQVYRITAAGLRALTEHDTAHIAS